MFNYLRKIKLLNSSAKTIGKVVGAIKYFKKLISENFYDVKEAFVIKRNLKQKTKLLQKEIVNLSKLLRRVGIIVSISIALIFISIVLWFLI